MTVLATATDPRFDVSRVDIDREGPTYTIDTLADLRKDLGNDCHLFFITGADALTQIVSWRNFKQLAMLAHFVGVTRPGHVLHDAGLDANSVSLLEIPALAISSSDCRERVRTGRPISYLVPDAVARYVDKRGLYR